MYSARAAAQLLPQIPNEPAMRRFIEDDMKNENSLETIIFQTKNRRQFFIRGEKIAEHLPEQLVTLV